MAFRLEHNRETPSNTPLVVDPHDEVEMQPLGVLTSNTAGLDENVALRTRTSQQLHVDDHNGGGPHVSLETVSLSVYLSTWRFWYKFIRVPIALVITNVCAFVAFVNLIDYWDFSDETSVREHILLIYIMFAAIVGSDAVALYYSALQVERDIAALEECPTSTGASSSNEPVSPLSFWAPTNVYGKVSKMLDDFLSSEKPQQLPAKIGRLSFLVNLLWALSALLGSASLTIFAVGLYSQSSLSPAYCKIISSQEDADQEANASEYGQSHPKMPANAFKGFPPELQSWAWYGDSSIENNYDDHWQNNELHSDFVVLRNGMTFFLGHAHERLYVARPNHNGILQSFPTIRNPSPLVLMTYHNTNDTTIASNHKMEEEEQGIKIVEDVDYYLPAIGFCCEYSDTREVSRRVGMRNVFCVYNETMKEFVWDPYSTLLNQNWILKGHNYLYDVQNPIMEMVWSEKQSKMWFRQEFSTTVDRTRTMYIILGTLEVVVSKEGTPTMKLSPIVAKEKTTETVLASSEIMNHDEELLELCFLHLAHIASFVMILASSGVSYYWLFRQQEHNILPAAFVPVCCTVVTIEIAYSGDWEQTFAYILCLLAILVAWRVKTATRTTLEKKESMIEGILSRFAVWPLYWSLLTLALTCAIHDKGFVDDGGFIVLGMVLVVLGLILQHPVLQVIGGVVAVVTVCSAVVSLLFLDLDFAFVELPMLSLLSLGLFRLGFYCRKYRPYIILYTQLLWRNLMTKIHHYSGSAINKK